MSGFRKGRESVTQLKNAQIVSGWHTECSDCASAFCTHASLSICERLKCVCLFNLMSPAAGCELFHLPAALFCTLIIYKILQYLKIAIEKMIFKCKKTGQAYNVWVRHAKVTSCWRISALSLNKQESYWLSLGIVVSMLIHSLAVPAGQWAWGGDCLCLGWSDLHHWSQSDCCQVSSRRECQCVLCRWGAWLQSQPSQPFPFRAAASLWETWNPFSICSGEIALCVCCRRPS